MAVLLITALMRNIWGDKVNMFGLIPRKEFPDDLAAKIKEEIHEFEDYLKSLGQNIKRDDFIGEG